MPYGADPGVIVQQQMEQQPLAPEFGEMPTAIIGPVVNTEEEALAYEDIEVENESIEDITIIHSEVEEVIDSDNSIDIAEAFLIDENETREPQEIYLEEDWVEDDAPGETVFKFSEEEAEGFLENVDKTWSGNGDLEELEGAKIKVTLKETREDLAGEEDDYIDAQGTAGIQQAVGLHYIDNPLGIAGWLADSVAPGTAVHFVPTEDYINGDADFDVQIPLALEKIKNTRVANVAALAPDDEDAMEAIDDLIINHAQKMSDDEESQFRTAWTGIKKPEIEDADGIQQKKQDEVEQLVSYTQSIFERKAVTMFQGGTFDLLDREDAHLNSSYLTAMAAVFKSSIEPEQGMTRLNVGSPLKKLDYKERYKPSLLTKLSEGGVWVWDQDNAGENIRCRFQTTTNTLNNRTRQQSAQATLDYISYAFMDTLDQLIGVNNVTADTINTVQQSAELLISSLKKDGKLRSGSQILEVYEDPNNSSRVKIKAQLVIPTPLDQIVITLVF